MTKSAPLSVDDTPRRQPQGGTLTLEVGYDHIFGGVFQDDALKLSFRRSSKGEITSDELGVFLRGVLREWGFDPAAVERVAVCSVMPEHQQAVESCSLTYFGKEPFFLRSGVKTGLKILTRNPVEVGPDRIAAAVGGVTLHPECHLIVADFDSVTTLDVIRGGRDYVGSVILPGLRTAMESLVEHAGKMPPVEILVPQSVVGRSTQESIQAGLYFGHLYALRSLMAEICQQELGGGAARIVRIATGSFAELFEKADLFDAIYPDLVLTGLYRTALLNPVRSARPVLVTV